MEREQLKKTIFISHCSDDRDILGRLKDTIDEVFEVFNVLFTYQDGSIPEGAGRGEAIRKMLNEADYMIAIITDAYLRSVICVSEICSFWAQNKHIIPIIYNGQEGISFLKDLFGEDIIYIDASIPNEKERADKLIEALTRKEGVLQLSEEKAKAAADWVMARQGDPDAGKPNDKDNPARPFIGGIKPYNDWMHYLLHNGIVSSKDGFPSGERIREKLADKDEVYIIGATNKGFVDNNIETLTGVVAHADVYILYAGVQSDFLLDVSQIEHEKGEDEPYFFWNRRVQADLNRLREEIKSIEINMMKVIADAEDQNRYNVYIGGVSTLIRQTVIMGIKNNPDGEESMMWGWLNTTIPPKRASETLGMEIESDLESGFASDLCAHARGLVRTAKLNGTLKIISDGFDQAEDLSEPTGASSNYEIDRIKMEWELLQSEAGKRMKERAEKGSVDLIEIAAQHPLENGEYPGEAFRERLDHGIALYRRLKNEGGFCRIFVPGSLHKGDVRSLSKAGSEYLLQNGIPREDIIDEDDSAEHIKKEWGIYNSADECCVAARIFKSDEEYRHLYCVCSANQVPRKKLFYIWNGVRPRVYCVPDDDFHDDLDELFDKVPNVIYKDQDWQGDDSVFGNRSREERMPGFNDRRQMDTARIMRRRSKI